MEILAVDVKTPRYANDYPVNPDRDAINELILVADHDRNELFSGRFFGCFG